MLAAAAALEKYTAHNMTIFTIGMMWELIMLCPY